jgi:hypothetical protein
MNDFGECTGCAKGERGGMRQEMQQSHPVLQQVPMSAEDDDQLQQTVASPPPLAAASATRLWAVRPRPVHLG